MRFRFGEHELDTEARTLKRRGKRIRVQAKVFDLLAYLIEHRERAASIDELLDALWPGVSVTPSALSRAVHKAREAVEDDGERQAVLLTEHGHGFRFVAEVSVLPGVERAAQPPTGFRSRWVATAGVAALLLAVTAVWLLNRPLTESAPALSVAVLPFANMSQDAAAEPFTNGIYDDILTHISKIRELKVIARTTMERLDPSLSVQGIGTKLGVAAVLEGGVQRAEDRVRINVQLIDCETEAHLWSDTYDRELTVANIFAIQSEIATAVADALKVTLSPEEQDRIASPSTENLAAYEAYLLGKQLMANRTIVSFAKSIEYYQQAIELDPNFTLAYVGLADSYRQLLSYSGAPRAETIAKAQAAASKALELDARLPEVYTSLAGISHGRGDFEGAEREFLRAVELSPSYGQAYHWYGVLLNEELGRHEEALTLFLKAAELDPLSAIIMLNVASALESLGRFEEALSWSEKSLELDPTHFIGNYGMASYHWQVTGKLDQAVVWYRRAISLDPLNPNQSANLGTVFLDLGDLGTATAWSDRAIALGPKRPWPNRFEQLLHLYRDDEAASTYARTTFPTETGPCGRPHCVFQSPLLTLLRDHYLSAGRYSDARVLFEQARPELFHEDDSQVNFQNWGAAIDLAAVLIKTGEQQRADLLLEKSWRHIQTKPRLGWDGYRLADVEIFALRGEKQEALSALRQAIDEGWRIGWWYCERNPNLESLHDEPEFQAMLEEVRADMAQQLARVREMERNGELAAIPRSEASLH